MTFEAVTSDCALLDPVHNGRHEFNILNDVTLTTVVDGKPGLGWCEMYWDSRYLAHMKQFPAVRR